MNRRKLFKLFIYQLVVGFTIATIGLTGCAKQSEGESNQEQGDLVISLTDAEGDFLNYTVDVLSITLTKANGAEVDTLPLETTVDFSRYTEMAEFLTAATVPSGKYTKASMTLDYADADIWVEDSAGNAVKVNIITDQSGDPITGSITVIACLSDINSIVIAPGIPSHLALDFDLNASNRVEFTDGVPELTVEPILLADINPEAPKAHRLRGPLKSVNVKHGAFKVILRPFYHTIRHGGERFGILNVDTLDNTVYDINGEQYEGKAGINALNELPIHSAIVVIGDLKFQPRKFEAREVLAGSSVPGGEMDVASGNVVSRNDNTMALKGVTLTREDGSVVFNDLITVYLSEETVFTRQLSRETYSIDDISIGQRVSIFGELINSDMGQLELDATAGYARMKLTVVRGSVIDNESTLVVDLQSIDHRGIGIFDFTGSGISPEDDADPDNYEIDTGVLNVSSLMDSSPVKVKGFVNTFGQAPADFIAQTVIDVSAVKAHMHVSWRPATASAFDDISIRELALNLDDAGPFHHIGRSGVIIDLTDLSESSKIKPDNTDDGRYFIIWNEAVQFHSKFENFSADLQNMLLDKHTVRNVFAKGFFDQSTKTLTAGFISIKLN